MSFPLLNLFDELLHLIATEFLLPHDRVALRRTCRYLHHIDAAYQHAWLGLKFRPEGRSKRLTSLAIRELEDAGMQYLLPKLNVSCYIYYTGAVEVSWFFERPDWNGKYRCFTPPIVRQDYCLSTISSKTIDNKSIVPSWQLGGRDRPRIFWRIRSSNAYMGERDVDTTRWTLAEVLQTLPTQEREMAFDFSKWLKAHDEPLDEYNVRWGPLPPPSGQGSFEIAR
jgi:hypothetical protein